MESGEIINRVASSSLITLDLEELYQPGDRVVLDIKDQLYQGLILKEADFRNFVKLHDWAQYQDKYVAIWCSADAIVPTWAYMLLGVALKPFAKLHHYHHINYREIGIFVVIPTRIISWSWLRTEQIT